MGEHAEAREVTRTTAPEHCMFAGMAVVVMVIR